MNAIGKPARAASFAESVSYTPGKTIALCLSRIAWTRVVGIVVNAGKRRDPRGTLTATNASGSACRTCLQVIGVCLQPHVKIWPADCIPNGEADNQRRIRDGHGGHFEWVLGFSPI